MNFEGGLRLILGDAAPADLPPDLYRKLEGLDRVVVRWSQKLDLVGFRTEEERLRRYFAEPLAASRWLPQAGRGLDIGSGGGSPGLPFALVRPRISWTFLEPRRRRRLFLEEAVRELGIRNVVVSDRRFEAGSPTDDAGGFVAISSRGVRWNREELVAIGSAVAVGGRFLLWIGTGTGRGAEECLSGLEGLEVEGPVPLIPGSPVRLLVVTRVG